MVRYHLAQNSTMTVEGVIELVQEKQIKLINFLSELDAHSRESHDELDKTILSHEREIVQMWKQDLDDILEELLNEEP